MAINIGQLCRTSRYTQLVSTGLLCSEFGGPCQAFTAGRRFIRSYRNSSSSNTNANANNEGTPGKKSTAQGTNSTITGNKGLLYGAKIPRATIPAQHSLRRLAGRLDVPPGGPISTSEYQHDENSGGLHTNDPQTLHQSQLNPAVFSQLYQPCTTVSTCERYDLAKVMELLYAQGLRSARILLPGEIAHVQYPFAPGKHADVLILSNGSVVSWGMTEVEVLDQIVPALKGSELRSYKQPESEDMDYVEKEVLSSEVHEQPLAESQLHSSVSENQEQSVSTTEETNSESNQKFNQESSGEEPSSSSTVSNHLLPDIQKSTMLGDVIIISGNSITERLLAKAAFSSGIARSTKLAALENSLDNHIESTKSLIDNLANGRELGTRGTTVLRLTGQLLQIRGQLNLYSELIETPDLYWEEPELESLYSLISKRLDVAPRIAILNKKLDYASESVNILKSHLSEEQGVRLEWMIIILIMVEVGFEIFHFIEHYIEKKSNTNEN